MDRLQLAAQGVHTHVERGLRVLSEQSAGYIGMTPQRTDPVCARVCRVAAIHFSELKRSGYVSQHLPLILTGARAAGSPIEADPDPDLTPT